MVRLHASPTARRGIHLTRTGVFVLIAGLLAGAAAAETRIYRTVDENGNVVFTDVPPKSDKEGQAVDLGQPNSFTPPGPSSPTTTVDAWLSNRRTDGTEDEDTGRGVAYESLQVARPADDEGLRDNAGNVAVVAAVRPELHQGHLMQVYLDGELRGTSPTSTFQLTNVDRGTHVVEVRIVDQSGNTLVSSDPSTFHLQRRSVLLQPPPRSGSN